MISAARLKLLGGVFIVSYLVLAIRLFQLSVIEGDEYQQKVKERTLRPEVLPARRGNLVDRKGMIMARDEPAYDLFARISFLDGRMAIRRFASRLRISSAQLERSIMSLEADLAAHGVAASGEFKVPGFVVHPREETLLELAIAPERTWGLSLHSEPSEADLLAHGVYVNLDELRGSAAIARVVALIDDRATAEELRALLAGKHREIIEKVERDFANVDGAERRKQKVLEDREGWSLPILRDVPAPLAAAMMLTPEAFVGFEQRSRAVRRHPTGGSAIHLIGLVSEHQHLSESRRKQLALGAYHDENLVGVSAAERAFESRLHGRDGSQVVEKHRAGGGKLTIHRREPVDGEDVYLTLDLRLQAAAEAALDAVGRPGAAVLLDPRTGEILALATAPRPTPQEIFTDYAALAEMKPSPLIDRTLRADGYLPPGSAYKLVTAVAALEENTIDISHTTYPCPSGRKPFCGNHSHALGALALTDALALSCNSFFAGAAEDSGSAIDIWTWRFGFGQSTGIEIGEDVLIKDIMRIRSMPQSSRRFVGIGQIIVATPLQIARMTAVFASGGYLITPHLDLTNIGTERRKLPIRFSTLEAVKRGMEAVVDRGTARGTGLDEFSAAGKTGSAELSESVAGSEEQSRTHAWFTGYAPRRDPEVVITVYLDQAGHGGEIAAPVAARILAAYFDLKGGQR